MCNGMSVRRLDARCHRQQVEWFVRQSHVYAISTISSLRVLCFCVFCILATLAESTTNPFYHEIINSAFCLSHMMPATNGKVKRDGTMPLLATQAYNLLLPRQSVQSFIPHTVGRYGASVESVISIFSVHTRSSYARTVSFKSHHS